MNGPDKDDVMWCPRCGEFIRPGEYEEQVFTDPYVSAGL